MREQADEFLADLASLGVSGFLEPLRRLPTFTGLLRRLNRFMDERRPAAVVAIDFYGFNRLVLEAAKRHKIRTFYYISPQVWASRPGRIPRLKRLVDRMLVIFPFEEELYRSAGIPVRFVGHPLLDRLPSAMADNGRCNGLHLGLLPGSRKSEILRHLPTMLEAAERIRKDFPKLEVLVFQAPHINDAAYGRAKALNARLVRDTDYAERRGLDLALTSSGTATLENALLGVPMVVVYRMSWHTYAIARALIRVPYISMANLLAGRPLVPELIQRRATPERVARAALDLLANPRRLGLLRRELASLRNLLGGPGASDRAARIILEEAGLAAAEHAGGNP